MDTEMLLKQIGARISARRRELNITQEQLAEKMDVSIQMISNLEKGKKAIRPENLIKLCETLGVSADFVLRGLRSEYEDGIFIKKYKTLPIDKKRILESILETW